MKKKILILLNLLFLGYCSLAQSQSVTPEQFGAVGDGIKDDTDAFIAAAVQIYTNGSGTLVLSKDKTYRVGRQYHVEGKYPYYQNTPIFPLTNKGKSKKEGLSIVIEGNGATVKLNDGLRIGSFDKDTGDVHNPKLPFTDRKYRTEPGNVFAFTGCSSVEISNLMIDGNVSKMILGGQWGDTGRQCDASGLYLSSCDRIRIKNVVSSHCGLDGILLVDWEKPTGNQDWSVSDSRFEYNARQGMSWCGGKDLTVTNCKFNHTGRDTFNSAPSAGLDIESESSAIRNGNFISCDFVNNKDCGMVADSGNSADMTFTKCLFWGTSSWSIWPKKPGFKFVDCTFHGQAVNVYGSEEPARATQFKNCRFEDVYDAPYEGGSYSSYSYQNNGALIGSMGGNVLLDNCTLVANRVGSGSFGNEGTVIIRGCDISHKSSSEKYRGIQCALIDVDISDTRFHESLEQNGKGFNIALMGNVSVGPNVLVDGPLCKWGSSGADGLTGAIPSKPTIGVIPSIVAPGGENIMAKVRYASGNSTDWVGLYAAGTGDGKRITWQYLNGLQSPPAVGTVSATLSFPAPDAAGKYELRLYSTGDNRSALLATSRSILASAVTVTAEPAHVQAGTPITVHVNNVPPADGKYSDSKNWIGLYHAAAADNDFSTKGGSGRIYWQYLNGLQSPPKILPASATLTFVAPVVPGDYDLRFFLRVHRDRCLTKSQKINVYAPEKK